MPKTASYHRRLEHYQRLIEISRDLASTLDLDDLLKRIVNIAVEMSGAQAASILLYDEVAQQLYFQVATNMDEPVMRGIIIPLEGSIAGWVVNHREPVNSSDVQNDPRFFGEVDQTQQFSTNSILAVPLIHKDKVLGVLEVLNKASGDFCESDLDIMMTLGAQVAIAIENTRLFQQSDLIAELVHELRTPLASLGTASYLLQRPEISDPQRYKLASTIYQESQRLNELASSFLDLARLESGRIPFQFKTFDPQVLIEECCGVIQHRAEETQVELIMEICDPLPGLEGDRDKLKQVLLNLLSNAVKYNRPPGSVTVSAYPNGKELKISVADTGIGIPPDEFTHLFQKFFRTRLSEKVASGTGLGLSICKRIVDSHRGRIDVKSKVGEGTTFTITLPLEQS